MKKDFDKKLFANMKKEIDFKSFKINELINDLNLTFNKGIRDFYFDLNLISVNYIQIWGYKRCEFCYRNKRVQVNDIDYFEKCFVNDSALEILSKIKSFTKENNCEILSKIEDTFKAIKLNKQLDEEILTSNEIKTKRKI